MKDDELKETAERRIKQKLYDQLFESLVASSDVALERGALSRFNAGLKRLSEVRKLIDGEQRRG